MKRVLPLIVACSLCVLPATADAATKSKVTIGYHTGTTWIGFVKSSKNACKNKRKVTLYREVGDKDAVIGSDKSQAGKGDSYVWSVPDATPADGTYYAQMKAKDGCSGDTSKPYEYPGDQPRR